MDTKENKIKLFDKIKKLRSPAKIEYDQRYLTTQSVINRIEIFKNLGMLDRRTLFIGDADLVGVALTIFGSPPDVLVADVDKGLSEVLFEANMEHDLPIRFVYHDMRIKVIEILLNQFALVVMEPPKTRSGIQVFLSRAIQCVQEGYEDGIFISVPNSGKIRDYFDTHIKDLGIEILNQYTKLNLYENGDEPSDFIQLKIFDRNCSVEKHWLDYFYEREENGDLKKYRCKCGEILAVKSIDELRQNGCPHCGYNEQFVFNSSVKLQ